jgi:hypothetical protein
MKAVIACTALSLALLPAAALAQSQSGQSKGSQAMGNQSGNQPMPAQIEKKLKDQGFSNVQVVPGSYIVSARDKQGDPVTMVIGPHSMTMFTTISTGDTTGAGSSQDQSKKN